MRTLRSDALRIPALRAFGAAGLLAIAACSGSASTEFSGDLFIESCSLACTNGIGGDVVSCGVVNVAENQEISILFSEPIDPSTVTSSTLQVTDTNNGTTPDGLRFVDPLDPRRVIFRPAISLEAGGVQFSFARNTSIQVLIPGVAQADSGPFITSVTGRDNQSRLNCTVFTSEGVADIVPGNPIVTTTVDVVTDFNDLTAPKTRTRVTPDPATAPRDVFRSSQIFFEFNELMNVPTIATGGQSQTIIVELDTDGDIATTGGDRIPVPGTFEVIVDQFTLTTSAVFTPAGEFPPGGTGAAERLIVVRITPAVRDVANLPVTTETGGGTLYAVPEERLFESLTLPSSDGETFDSTAFEDVGTSGGEWGSGSLSIGTSGGSGRHGELLVRSGETVVLSTNADADFPNVTEEEMAALAADQALRTFPRSIVDQVDVIGNRTPGLLPEDPPTYPLGLTVDDGVFEFSSLIVEPGGTLMLRGSQTARIVVRGRFEISGGGRVDVSGVSAPTHDSTAPRPSEDLIAAGTLPIGGPGGGDGGVGADRADLAGTNLTAAGGVDQTGFITDRAGRAGGDIPGTSIGAGNGGVEFPATLPTNTSIAAGGTNLGGVGFNVVADPLALLVGEQCFVQQLAGSGSGGGYALPGGEGASMPVGAAAVTGAPVTGISPGATAGGDNAGLALADPQAGTRLLRWQDGDLRGGAGGGGGGNHPYGTFSNAGGVAAPTDPIACISGFLPNIDRWLDHSGASGGGAGGAVGVLAGREILVDGTVDASGGDGGSSLTVINEEGSFAMPGGGGSGGAVRLRAPFVAVGPIGRIDVSGGNGGTAPWSLNLMGMRSDGGDGSAGLIRIEDANADVASQVNFMDLVDRVLPDPNNPTQSLNWLSVAPTFFGVSEAGTARPDSMNGSTSCWIVPADNGFLNFNFRTDDQPNPGDKGWTLDVVTTGGIVPFRDNSGTDWETTYGNVIGGAGVDGSPIVIRFQGGRTSGASLDNICDVDLNDPLGEVLPGSLTPWVADPADLNVVLDPTGSTYSSNMVRYCIIFDRTQGAGLDRPGDVLISEGVLGVDNLFIFADPN